MLGKRLEKFLKEKNVSFAELSRKTGKSKGYYSNILSNPGANPTKEFFDKLKETFPDLNINWLITGKGSMLETCQPETEEEKARVFRETTKKEFGLDEQGLELLLDLLTHRFDRDFALAYADYKKNGNKESLKKIHKIINVYAETEEIE